MSEFLNRKENSFSPQRQAKKINAEETRAAQLKELEYRIQRKPLQKFAQDEEEDKVQRKSREKEELQKKNDPTSASSNTQMPGDVQSKMENAFGTDFSDVNIHKDSDQATNLGALAYTQGNDIHFAPGQYEPGSQKGQELLAHELTHVQQQREGRVKPDTKQHKGLNLNSDTSLEKEADEAGAKAAQGKMANVRVSGNGVQMQSEHQNKTITDQELIERYC